MASSLFFMLLLEILPLLGCGLAPFVLLSENPALPFLVLFRGNETDHGLVGDDDPGRQAGPSDERGFCRKEKSQENDDEISDDHSLGQSQPHAERPIHPTEKHLSEKVTQSESEHVTDNQDQSENEGEAYHGEVGKIRDMGFEACRQLGLELTPEENAQDHACERCDLPEKSPKDSLHQEKNHGADNKNIQDIHEAMFIRARKSPSRTEWKHEGRHSEGAPYEIRSCRFHKKNVDENYILWHEWSRHQNKEG